MSDIDQQFIEYVVKSLVGNPDAVHVDRRVDEKGVLLELTVDPEDLGRVIGKRGATAQSLRTLLRALGTKNDARYNLKIIDNGTGGHGRSDDDNDHQTDDTSAPSNDVTETSESTEVPEDKVEAVKPAKKAVEEPKPTTPPAEDRLAQTRRELAEFDDLDL